MEEFDEAVPFIRSGIALLLFMKFGSQFVLPVPAANPMKASVKRCYSLADEFVSELRKDVESGQDGLTR
jgi:hypothetical protein